MTPDDLATLPTWVAAELRRQAEEIAALRAALEGAERRARQGVELLRRAAPFAEWVHGPSVLTLEIRAFLSVSVDDAGRGKEA